MDIPESGFSGHDNVIFALNVKLEMRGRAFLASFTEGDNSLVVTTDSMKNLVLRHAADYEGSSVEGFLHHISRILLSKYSQMTSVHISADRIPFEVLPVPESHDRPLFIWHNIGWKYANELDAISPGEGSYVAAEQIRDIAHTVFHDNHSPSIQHLIYLIGLRMLFRFPQLSETCFESNNRTWETVVEDIPGSEGRVIRNQGLPTAFRALP